MPRPSPSPSPASGPESQGSASKPPAPASPEPPFDPTVTAIPPRPKKSQPRQEIIPEEFDELLGKKFGPQPKGVANLARIAFPHGVAKADELEIPASRPGHALFRVPRLMWTETAELAELRLAATDPLSVKLRAAMEKTMVGRGIRTDEHAVERVGRRMKAQLMGDARFFEIEPLSSAEQDFGDGDRLGWDWRVIPKREGHSLLTLRMTMTANLRDEPISIDTQALHTSVDITVKSLFTRPTRFFRDNWKWMLGSSGIGAVAAIYALVAR